VKPTDPFSEKCIYKHKIEIVRFIEVKNIFEPYSPKITSLLTFVIERKAEFQFEVSEYKAVTFIFPSKLTDPLKYICGSQVRNC